MPLDLTDSNSIDLISPSTTASNMAPSADDRPAPIKGPLQNKLLDAVIRTPNRVPSPQPTHLGIPGQPHKVLHEPGTGYVAPKFEGKTEQMDKVMDALEVKNFIPTEFVESETRWFYEELGIDDMYFQTESVEA
jgi:glutamate dehydrogenase